ncbi:MAG: ankyrin repeat domain-containing protein [Desulfomonilaceae bacterium]
MRTETREFEARTMIVPAVLLIITAWALIAIIRRIRRNAKIGAVHWAVLLIGLIGIDLWRILEGFTPALKDSSDLFLFLMCSFLVVVCPPLVLGIYRYIVSKQPPTHCQWDATEPLDTLRRDMAARTAKAGLVVVITFVLIVFYSGSILLGAAYTYGISWLPNEKNPSGQGLPALAVEAAWIAEFGSGPMVMEPWPVYILIRPFLPRPYCAPDLFENLIGLPNGHRAAGLAARVLLSRDPLYRPERSIQSKMRADVVAIWISRNWTADQAIRTVFGESYYLGNGCHGLEEASRGYFGCLPNQLTIDEIALLVGLLRSPSAGNPWRHPASAKKQFKYVLAKLASKHGSDPSEPDPQLLSRLLPGPRWSTCENKPDIDGLQHLVRTYSQQGELSNLEELLRKGVDVNEKDRYCRTALMYACRRGHLETMTLLLDKGADINAQNDFGWTALMEASLWGRFDVVNVLVNRGADVNVKDNWGATALMLASSNGHTVIVKLLKDHGAKE